MKIVLKLVAAGPEWAGQAGETVDVPERQALALVDGGHATPAEIAPDAPRRPETAASIKGPGAP